MAACGALLGTPLAAAAAPVAPRLAAGVVVLTGSPTQAPLQPLPVQPVKPLVVSPRSTPPSEPAAVPVPGAVAGVAAPPAAARPASTAAPTAQALLPPVAVLPTPSASTHDDSATPLIVGLFGLIAVLLLSTILLARRRL